MSISIWPGLFELLEGLWFYPSLIYPDLPVPGEGTVYVTAPGARTILRLDRTSHSLAPVVTIRDRPWHIDCGPDNLLYVEDSGNRVARFNQDGSGRTVVLHTARGPSQMTFLDADLYFGTAPNAGVWRVRGVVGAAPPFKDPEQVLPPDVFKNGDWVHPYVVRSGLYQGDILVIV